MKRFFLTPALMLCAGLLVAAINPALDGDWGAAGVVIANSAFLLVLAFIMVGRRARWSARAGWAWLTGLFGLGLSFWHWVAADGRVAHVIMAATGFAALVAYSTWYARLDRWTGKVRVGEVLRDFTVFDESGNAVSSDSFDGAITLLVFYRGNWCPLCTAQIREVAARYRELADMGVRVVLISPQPSAKSAALAQRFDAPMAFFEDRQLAAAKRLGLEHPGGLPLGMEALGYASDTVMPTVIVTDAERIVRYLDETRDYRVRPEPSTFIGLIRNRILN